MKTSNILFTTAIVIILTSLVVYNFALKAEYIKLKELGFPDENKTNRFSNYESINVDNFNTIDLQVANVINVKIEHGKEEAVWILKAAKPIVSIRNNKKFLVINLTEKGKQEHYYNQENVLIIVSPEIKAVNTSAITFVSEKGNTKTTWRHSGELPTLVSGFNQDSLSTDAGADTKIELTGNHLKTLNSTVGDKTGNGTLIFSHGNNIGLARLDVRNLSTVAVNDSGVKDIKYTISDGAIVSLRGTELKKILAK